MEKEIEEGSFIYNGDGFLCCKIGVRIISDTMLIGFLHNKRSFGEVIIFSIYGELEAKGFSDNDYAIGKGYLRGHISFHSLFGEHEIISEGEYRKELYSIRMGLIEEPFSYKLLSMRLPYNWGEILNKEILDFEGGEKILEYYERDRIERINI